MCERKLCSFDNPGLHESAASIYDSCIRGFDSEKEKQDGFRKKEKIKRGTETEREIKEGVKKRIEKEIKF